MTHNDPTVFLVDDDSALQRSVEAVLHSVGIPVESFSSAEEFLEKRDPSRPGCMLLDLKMPKVDGLEVLRHIKGDANLRTIPVVMLTSSREEQDLVESYELGVNGYVVKPVDFSEFMNAVRQIGVFWALVNEPPPSTRRIA